jgi:ABC-type phosphate transport system substrate-binding protein
MSDTTSAPNRGARVVRKGLLALSLTALAAIGLASSASADFTTSKCAGTAVAGRGGSFAKEAQAVWGLTFKPVYCSGSGPNVSYESVSSGAGVKSMQLRTDTPRFGGTDDPPTPAEVALINSGGTEVSGSVVADSDPTNDGKAHVFPVAIGAVVALVNFPEGCSPEPLADKYRTVSAAAVTGTPALKGILRVRFTKVLYEKIWAGESNVKWSEAFPELVAQGAPCEKSIMRVVRQDQSGTTFAFKDYLSSINPARGWKTTWATTGPNKTREWPSATFGKRDDCGNKNGVQDAGDPELPGSVNSFEGILEKQTDFLTTACGTGNGELIKTLAATDGSVGYADLATARNSSPTLAVNAGLTAAAPTTPYWTQVQNGSITVGSANETNGLGFTEPTFDETNGFKTTGGQKGANCLSATITGAPSDSFGNWANTSAVNSATGWGICTLTYAIVFDDNLAVWNKTPAAEEEAKARSVKDYEEHVVSEAGQNQLFGADYAPLPAGMVAIARKAVSGIGWNKAGSGGGNPGGGGNPSGGGSGGGGGGGTVTPPSNKFSVPRTTISSAKGTATFSVKLPGAGKLDVLGTAKNKGKKLTVGHVVLTASKAGTYSVTLKPSGAAKALLNQKGKLKVSLAFTFTPTGGSAGDLDSSVTLKLVKQK